MVALLPLLLAAPVAVGSAPEAPPPALTLAGAVAMALERSTDVRRSQLAVATAEAERMQARAAILPRLDVTASASRARGAGGEVNGSFVDPATGDTVLLRTPTQTYSSYAATLNVTQLLFDGGKWWNNIEASDLGLGAAQEGLEEARLQTTYVVETRFYDLLRAQRQLRVLEDAARRSRDQAEATQELFEAGRQNRSDVYGARANRDNDEIARLAQVARVELARQELAVAIGAEADAPLAIEEPPRLLEEPAPVPPADLAIAKAYSSRPGLKALALTVDARRRAAAAATGDYWPALSLGASYDRRTWELGTFTSSLDKAGTVSGGVFLTWNVFDGLATTAAVKKASVHAQESENDLEAARRSVASQVQAARIQLSAARETARVAKENEETAREGLRYSRMRQQAGAATQLEVRDAELKLTQSQLALVAALVGGRQAEAALRRAMGTR